MVDASIGNRRIINIAGNLYRDYATLLAAQFYFQLIGRRQADWDINDGGVLVEVPRTDDQYAVQGNGAAADEFSTVLIVLQTTVVNREDEVAIEVFGEKRVLFDNGFSTTTGEVRGLKRGYRQRLSRGDAAQP